MFVLKQMRKCERKNQLCNLQWYSISPSVIVILIQ